MDHLDDHVVSGEGFRLADHDPDDRRAAPGPKAEEKERLRGLSERIDRLQDMLYADGRHRLLVVLQGMDTSGKDGTIRHVFSQVDPLGVRVAAFKAPTDEEKAHGFLWRVHRHVPRRGEIAIFNRSHYEDVLIVRVRGWIDGEECRRRYGQINDFERMLAEHGTTILKFFLHISKDEQRRRLQERIDRPDKRWKFDSGDLAERLLWDDYQRAYEDAIAATSTPWAPWRVVPANSKTNRNLAISMALLRAMEGMDLEYPEPKEDLEGVVVE